MVVVDTSVWVQFFKVADSQEHRAVTALVRRKEAAMVGAVLAEILQGARNEQEMTELDRWLTPLPYLAETRETWARVGDLSFRLRRKGERLFLMDLVIAALALEHDCELYTLDEHFQRIPGVKLHEAGGV